MEESNNKNMWSDVKYLDNLDTTKPFNFNGKDPFPNVYFISEDYRINLVRALLVLLVLLTPIICYRMKSFKEYDANDKETLNVKKYISCILPAEIVYILCLAYLTKFK